MSEESHFHGHRNRLREKFRSAGSRALADYEFLELLLFSVFRRRDTKPLAKRLIGRFGSLGEVISAPRHLLLEVPDLGEAAVMQLKIVEATMQRVLQGRIKDRTILSSWSSVLEYCYSTMAFETTEQFRILFLDRQNALIADEIQQVGTVDHTPVYPREIIKRTLELSSSGIILVHNHPSGDPTPSRADVIITKKIIDAGTLMGIEVYDHIIIGKKGSASMREMGLISDQKGGPHR